MNDPLQGIGKLVPGFDFLQDLVKNAGTALPSFTQWVAPTLDPEELDKRIGELRAVQFWLEQNARMLGTTIQAMEVQRMTLSTLQSMNVPLETLRESLQVRTPAAAPSPAPEPPPTARKRTARKAAQAPAPAAEPGAAGTGPVDPMQWWNALTQQFGTLAANTMNEAFRNTATEAAGKMATDLMQQSMHAAESALRQTLEPEAPAAARKTTRSGARPRGATPRGKT